MSTITTVQDKAVWSVTNAIQYPNMAVFENTRDQNRKRELAVPIEAQWKSVLTGFTLSTHVQAWLDQAII